MVSREAGEFNPRDSPNFQDIQKMVVVSVTLIVYPDHEVSVNNFCKLQNKRKPYWRYSWNDLCLQSKPEIKTSTQRIERKHPREEVRLNSSEDESHDNDIARQAIIAYKKPLASYQTQQKG